MTKYRALDGDRLDQIVFKYYGDLSRFEEILALNPKLPVQLQSGDMVLMPSFKDKKEIVKEKALW